MVQTASMMVFGMTRLRGELTTYRVRGGHANDWANRTQLHLVNWVPFTNKFNNNQYVNYHIFDIS